jgi:hypothetical protein
LSSLSCSSAGGVAAVGVVHAPFVRRREVWKSLQ